MKKLSFIILGLCLLICNTSKSQTVCVPSNLSVVSTIDSAAAWIGSQTIVELNIFYDSIKANKNQFLSLDSINQINSLKLYLLNYIHKKYPK